ncbi:MAG TPA: acetyl-CoA C-acyltransferase [Noviherbaspirillum sp.]|nr:acetyl-CoA C-acyltransferase [Noviherbaspirillum sp.]
MNDPIVILGAARTPIGAFQGAFSTLSANELGAVAIRAAIGRAGIEASAVQEVVFGNCLIAGQGQAPARQAAIKAGLPFSTGAVTLSKMCGSGMKALMQAHDSIVAGTNDIVAAGGMESMTNAPYLLPKARGGYRLGHGTIVDHMALDGLEDAYQKGQAMGVFAEMCAAQYRFTRADQDEYALESVRRARQAAEEGAFGWEIAPVGVESRTGTVVVDADEGPTKARPEKIPQLKPAFAADGTITAASSSSINDGAAALILTRASRAQALGLKPIARILGHASHSQEPEWFTTAPVGAMRKLMQKLGSRERDFDLFEVNEAFATVPMAVMQEFDIRHERLNVHGGACVLGHPIGASGARIVVTLIGALRRRGLQRGMAALCIGGGEGTALALELELA